MGDTLKIGDTGSGTGNINHFQAAGMLTTSKSEIVWSLPIPESLKNISTITLTSSKVWVRVINTESAPGYPGYLLTGVNIKTQATNVSIGKINDHLITISASKTGGWTNASINNSPLVVSGECDFSFS